MLLQISEAAEKESLSLAHSMIGVVLQLKPASFHPFFSSPACLPACLLSAEMDGLEASRLLQQLLPPEQRPVVVALSADTLQVLHDRCKEAGIQEFICKPFRIEDVQRVLALVPPRLATAAQPPSAK